MLAILSRYNIRQQQTLLVCCCALLIVLGRAAGINFGASVISFELFTYLQSSYSSINDISAEPLSAQTQLLPTWLMYVLGGLILCLGVPHGALDFDLAKRKMPLKSYSKQFTFILLYIFISMLCVSLWYFFAPVALCIFISISIIHFASDWRTYIPVSLSTVTAVWILTIPALLQPTVFMQILSMLWLSPAESQFLRWGFSTISVVSSVALLFRWKSLVSKDYFYLLELIAYVIILMFSHLLVFFTVYFCIVHSSNYLLRYYQYINSQKSHLLTQIIGIMLLTFLLGLSLVHYSQTLGINSHFYTWLFVGLFGLTVPHMLLVERYFTAEGKVLDKSS